MIPRGEEISGSRLCLIGVKLRLALFHKGRRRQCCQPGTIFSSVCLARASNVIPYQMALFGGQNQLTVYNLFKLTSWGARSKYRPIKQDMRHIVAQTRSILALA